MKKQRLIKSAAVFYSFTTLPLFPQEEGEEEPDRQIQGDGRTGRGPHVVGGHQPSNPRQHRPQ